MDLTCQRVRNWVLLNAKLGGTREIMELVILSVLKTLPQLVRLVTVVVSTQIVKVTFVRRAVDQIFLDIVATVKVQDVHVVKVDQTTVLVLLIINVLQIIFTPITLIRRVQNVQTNTFLLQDQL